MKEKGFTLIELLAVIVILAIIALIATPIVLNIIKDSKDSATLQSADLYLGAVETAVAKQIIDDPKFRPETCNIQADGNLKCDGTEVVVEIEISGEKPTSGTITLKTGTITGVTLVLSGKTITKNTEGKLVYQTIPTPKSFTTDSWETIAANINSDVYKVGDTKELALIGFTNTEPGSNGLYTIRIANKTNTGDLCVNEYYENEDGTKEMYSKTACGFVIEFVDIIAKYQMNSNGLNKGGYPSSSIHTYIQNDIYNALPNDLKKFIIDTTSVSGYGSGDAPNKATTDKMYLLSGVEIYGAGDNKDTASYLTRQLDYYNNLRVTTSSYSDVVKKYNGSSENWWLRTATSWSSYAFNSVWNTGSFGEDDADVTIGIAVAFRIG